MGYQVVAVARHEAELRFAAGQIAASGVECEAVVADVGRPEAGCGIIAAAVRRFGRVDVLVNNAGVAPLAALEELAPAEFERVYAVNMAAVYHTTRAVWPIMKRQGGGVIVNISSRASIDPFPGFAVYGASKAWVNLLTQALAAEGRPHGILIYSVAPAAVETKLMRAAFPDFPADQTLDADEVAGVIVTLCDAAMSPCSGQTIFVRR
jgi:3-oxoacyl-[acyl-carrier protein] reductase